MHPPIDALLSPSDDVLAHLRECASCRGIAGLADPPPAGRYQRLEPLHRGGMGRTVRALDRVLGREVLLKELVAPPGMTSGQLRARFEREARLTARLVHPSILPVYDLGGGDAPFYAMPFVEGGTLAAAIDAARTPAARLGLVRHAATVAAAIAFAHDHGVVHRDIKPDNVLVGRFGQVVVIDWGLASVLGEADAALGAAPDDGLTRFGVGTPAYMPPEQASGAPADPRHDVYALGATLYHVLAGVPPYHGASDVRARLLEGPPQPLYALAPQAPPELVGLVERAMARDPARRFRDASAVAEELERFVAGRLLETHRYTVADRLVRFARRNRAVVATGGLAAAVAAGVAVVSGVEVARARTRAEIELERSLASEAELLAASPERTAEALTTAVAAYAVAERGGRSPTEDTVRALRTALRSGPAARRDPGVRGWGLGRRSEGVPWVLTGVGELWSLGGERAVREQIPIGQAYGRAEAPDGRILAYDDAGRAALGRVGGPWTAIELPITPLVSTFAGDYAVIGDGAELAWIGADGAVAARFGIGATITQLGWMGEDVLAGDASGTVHRVSRDGTVLAAWSAGEESVLRLIGGDVAWVSTSDGVVSRIDADGLTRFGVTEGGPASELEVAGGCLLYGASSGIVNVQPVAPGACGTRSFRTDQGAGLAPDGRSVVVTVSGRSCAYDTTSGARRACFRAPGWAQGARWLDSRRVYTSGYEGVVVWDAGTSGMVGHDAEIVALADLGRVLSVARDGTMRLQGVDGSDPVELEPLSGGASAAAAGDGRAVVGSYSGELVLVGPDGIAARASLRDAVGDVWLGEEGIAAGTLDGELALFDAELRRVGGLEAPGGVRQILRDDGWIVLGTDGVARRLAEDGAVVGRIGGEPDTIGQAAIANGEVWLRDRTGTSSWAGVRLEGRLVGVAGEHVVTASRDGLVRTYAGGALRHWFSEASVPRRVTRDGYVVGGDGGLFALDGALVARGAAPLADALVADGWLVLADVEGGLTSEPLDAETARDVACQRLAVLGTSPEGC